MEGANVNALLPYALGWDFFHIYFDSEFIGKLLEVHPDIQKEEGHMVESSLQCGFQSSLRKEIWNITLS